MLTTPVPKKMGRCFAFTWNTLRSRSAKMNVSSTSPPKLRMTTMFAAPIPARIRKRLKSPMQPQQAAAPRIFR